MPEGLTRTLAIAPKGGQNAAVLGVLREIHQVLGTTKSFIWPFMESTGSEIKGFAPNVLNSQDEAGNVNLELEFTPIIDMPEVGIHMYHFSGDNNRHLVAADHASYSFAGTAEPFGLSVWALPMEGGSALQTLMAKYDEGVATEYSFHITSADVLELILFDGVDGGTGTATYTSTTAVDLHELRRYSFSYAGGGGIGTLGAVEFYKDGVLDDTVAGTETLDFIIATAGAAKMFVGGRDDGGVPDDLFQGWLALPEGAGKLFTAADQRELYQLERNLVGV